MTTAAKTPPLLQVGEAALRPWITASKIQLEPKTPPESKNPVYLEGML